MEEMCKEETSSGRRTSVAVDLATDFIAAKRGGTVLEEGTLLDKTGR